MAIASPSAPSFSASISCTRTDSAPVRSLRFSPIQTRLQSRRFTLACCRSSVSSPNGCDDDGDLQYELQHGVASHHRRRGSPVFVTLPVDAVSLPEGTMKRKKVMAQSLRALAAAGVEGVVMEVWWGLVERELPRVYNWQGYLDIVMLAKRCGLKVRAVMAFHQCGAGPADPLWAKGSSETGQNSRTNLIRKDA